MNVSKTYYCIFGFFSIVAMPIASIFADVNTSIDPETQQRSWLLTTTEGLELKIAQIVPDQAHGFFLARGFPSTIASRIATHCPMQTVIRNTGTQKKGVAITVILKEWRVKTIINNKEKQQGIKLKETWNKEWQDIDIPTAAKLAFRWATFPSEQTFQPSGDYNWGIITIGLPSSSTHSFDLKVVWHQDGVQKSEWIRAIDCAKNN